MQSSGIMQILSKLKIMLNPMFGVQIIKNNRELLWQLVKRNVASRYRGSMLGFFWSLAQPLMMLCVYTFVFSVVFKLRWGERMAETQGGFALVMFCGMAFYNIFSESVSASAAVIVQSPNYVKKVIFPLEILPVAQVLSSCIVGMIWFVMLLIGIFWVNGSLPWTTVLLPVVLLPLMFFSCGIALFVASLGVYLRDIQYVIGIILQILFFMTPIFYPISAVPEKYQLPLRMNPLSIMIEQGRDVLLRGQLPDWGFLGVSLLAGIVVTHLGMVWFYKTKKGFADVL